RPRHGPLGRAVERPVLKSPRDGAPVESIQSVVSKEEVLAAQQSVRSVRFDDSLESYLLEIVSLTRSTERFRLGVSTRAALAFYRGCQARAVTDGRDFVIPDDIKALAVPVLAHRILLDDFSGDANRSLAEEALAELVDQVPVPV
ncbi:MAG: MoxR family ATPase, partial [Planctomycetota bacterium]